MLRCGDIGIVGLEALVLGDFDIQATSLASRLVNGIDIIGMRFVVLLLLRKSLKIEMPGSLRTGGWSLGSVSILGMW
jgi:hypothetical protein